MRTAIAAFTISTGVRGSLVVYETRSMFVPSVSTLKCLRTSARSFVSFAARSNVERCDVRSTTSRMKLSLCRSWVKSSVCCEATVWMTGVPGSSGLELVSSGDARNTQIVA